MSNYVEFGEPLSEREKEVLAWVKRKKTSREIAAILGISKKTVKGHVYSATIKLGVRQKLGARTREGLVKQLEGRI